MNDIKTIALNLNVTKQTIYNHVKKNYKELKSHIFKMRGITYIDDEGVLILKRSMEMIDPPVTQYENFTMEEVINQISDSVRENMKTDLQELLADHERNIQEKYEQQLENFKDDFFAKYQKQTKIENEKLMQYLADRRSQEQKKGLFSRLFSK